MPGTLALLQLSPLAVWWSALAVLAAGVAVPVVLHLWNRGRVRTVPWAAMRFVREAVRRTQRRAVWEERLLLAVRVGVVLLILGAAVLAQPWAQALLTYLDPSGPLPPGSSASRTHHVLVLDSSLSMAQQVRGESAFERAKRELIEQVVRPAPAGDGFSLVLMEARPRSGFGAPSEDHEEVARYLATLRQTHGPADLEATCNHVVNILEQSRQAGRYRRHEVHFVSDLQAATWQAASHRHAEVAAWLARISESASTDVTDAGTARSFSLAVTRWEVDRAYCTTRDEVVFTAVLKGQGAAPKRVSAGLWIGTAIPEARQGTAPVEMTLQTEQIVELPDPPSSPEPETASRSNIQVRFRHRFAEPGTYAVQVRIDSGDGLEPDDLRSLVVTVRERLPVLLVDGRPVGSVEDHETYYLRHALANPRYQVQSRVVTPWELAQQPPGSADGIEAADCIFLCNVPRLAPREIERLESHLHRGGGIVFFLGDQVDAAGYNQDLHRQGEGLFPVELATQVPAASSEFYYFDPRGYQHPLLNEFAGRPNSGLLRARSWRYWRVQAPPGSKANVALAFLSNKPVALAEGNSVSATDSGAPSFLSDPAVVEADRHNGKVFVVTTSADLRWTSWPLNPSFVPFVQELLLQATAGLHRNRPSVVGEPLELKLPHDVTDAAMLTPDGRREAVHLTGQLDGKHGHFEQTGQSGFYRLLGPAGDEPDRSSNRLFAVNIPTEDTRDEGDPRRLTEGELRLAYPGWEFTYSTQFRERRADPVGLQAGLSHGCLLAGVLLLLVELMLAWHVGRSLSRSTLAQTAPPQALGWFGMFLRAWLVLVSVALLALVVVIAHWTWTGELLGFLPTSWRLALESKLGIAPPSSGEGRTWQLHAHSMPLLAGWLWYVTAVLIMVLTAIIHLFGKSPFGWGGRVLTASTRLTVLCIVLGLMLPQWVVSIQNYGHPSIIVVLDESESMATQDVTQPAMTRLQAAQQQLLDRDQGLLLKLLQDRQEKVRLYGVGENSRFLGELQPGDEARWSTAEETLAPEVLNRLRELQPRSSASRLGPAVRQIIEENAGVRPGALILWSDFAATDGERLRQVAAAAKERGLPFYLVGVGDAGRYRKLRLHDLQVSDSVYVHDTLVIEARLTAEGYTAGDRGLLANIRLLEKDRAEPLAVRRTLIDPHGQPTQVRLEYQPTEPGERTFILEALPEGGAGSGSRLQQKVDVLPIKTMKVLYLEGYPRYEFRFLKDLLERQLDPATKTHVFDLKVVLFEADPGFSLRDGSVLDTMPTARELESFDVVIFGDVNPASLHPQDANLRNLRDQVRVRGGGFVMIAGPRHTPGAYRGTPLAEILPIDLLEPLSTREDQGREPYAPAVPAATRLHPILSSLPEETWAALERQSWFAAGYRARPEAEILAVHPQRPSREALESVPEKRHPLILDWRPGAGRSMFFGFHETWSWRSADGGETHGRFWLQTLRYLTGTKLGRVTLTPDRQEPYRRGETIRITARFPEEMRTLPDEQRLVLVQRVPPREGQPVDSQVHSLSRVADARGLYELRVDKVQEGSYRFQLLLPQFPTQTAVECQVLGPPGEQERLFVDIEEMREAAKASGGRAYLYLSAEDLLKDIPRGKEIPLGAVKETPLWDHPLIWGLALALLVSEWFLRRWKGFV